MPSSPCSPPDTTLRRMSRRTLRLLPCTRSTRPGCSTTYTARGSPGAYVRKTGLSKPRAKTARRNALSAADPEPATSAADPASTTARQIPSNSLLLGRRRTRVTVAEALLPAATGVRFAPVNIFVIGAGQVGVAVGEALHEENNITVLDTEPARLQALAGRFDVATYEGDGTSRRDLAEAGIKRADLVIACTSRDEVNLVAGMFARREARNATTVIRTANVEYVEVWREGQLDVDFVV